MVKLFEQYKSLLPKDLTLSEERYQYLRRRMKTRIEHELHDLLIVHTMGNGRILLIPKTLSLNDVVEENVKLSEIIEKDSLISQESKMVINVANILRHSFHNHKPSLSWPPNVSELDMGEMKMSELSLLFWKSLFDVPKSRELSIKELSLIQDLSYATTRVPYPKHFLLTILTRALSGNVELITTLNRLGHGISHSGLSEVMTAVSMQKVKDTALNDVVLPDELQFGEPTTLVFDNIDRLEETLSGSGTSYRVNGIAVQRGFIGPRVEKKRASMSKTMRRSIQIEDIFLTPYNVGTKPPPPYLMGLVQRYKKFHRSFSLSKEDVLWVIARYIHQKCQNIPSWTGFNILLRTENMVIKDNIGYLPSINHPATSMATINEMLCQALRIKDQIGIESIFLVCDQAIYAKAIEVAWADQEKFEPIILRLGTFHTICTFLADAGLRDIAIESAAIAVGSVKGAFQGKQYNRAVRFHKLLYEALMRILWEKFCNRIDDSETAESSILREISERLSENPTNETYNGILLDPRFDVLINSFSVFFDNVQAQRGTMSTFWMSYMTMVKTILDIIRASREGNLLLHLESVESIIPWCFAYNRTNYARYLPYYVQSMKELQTSKSEIWEYLCNRGFSVQMSSSNSFGRIPLDQTIEETANKDTQTSGGTKGFSLKTTAVSRYYITADFRRSCVRQLRQSIHPTMGQGGHPDPKSGRIRRDEKDVHTIWDLFQTVWKNPFEDDELCNLATAVEASPAVREDLLRAYHKGIEAYNTFVEERLIKRDKGFEARIPKMNLKTFDDMNKKVVKVGDKEVELKVDRNLFAKMAVIAQHRKLDTREVLSHELGPFPWSLATCDGMLRKTNKAILGKDLEESGCSLVNSELSSACVIDAMSFVHKLSSNHKTFEEISKDLFQRMITEGKSYGRIDFVFDKYQSISIKKPERIKRGETNAPAFANILPGHKITQWSRFLKSSHNKSSLINFFVQEWKKEEYLSKLEEQQVYIGYEDTCIKLVRTGVTDVEELICQHEEADTRLLFHAAHASQDGYKNIEFNLLCAISCLQSQYNAVNTFSLLSLNEAFSYFSFSIK